MNNQSVPTNAMLAHVTYEDLEAAAAWLYELLGFSETFRYGDPVAGIQVRRGDVVIMLNLPTTIRASPKQTGTLTQSLTIVVDNADAVLATVNNGGGAIVEQINETIYGERQFVVADPEGHHWLIAEHVQDITPEAWGAVPFEPA